MKRSEMIGLIKQFMNDSDVNVPYVEDDTYEMSLENYSLQLLEKLEQAGMQPPSIKEPCETWVLVNGKHIRTEDSFVFTHKWDEE